MNVCWKWSVKMKLFKWWMILWNENIMEIFKIKMWMKMNYVKLKKWIKRDRFKRI
jgi:hypothetical protein